MKRTIIVVPEGHDHLKIVAEADSLADALKAARALPDGKYHVASFQEIGMEVGPPVRSITRVVRRGTPTTTRQRKPKVAAKH